MAIDKSKLSLEELAMLERQESTDKQTQMISDMQEKMNSFNPQIGLTINNLEKELQPILEKLTALDKEAPEATDQTTPVVEAVKELESAISKAISSIKMPDVKPQVNVEAPNVKVDAPQVTVELDELEKLLESIPGAFDKAIANIPIPEQPDNTDLYAKLDEVIDWLENINVATRLKPQTPSQIKVTNPDGSLVGSSGGGGGTQYADGAVRGTATGTLEMVDDGTNIQSRRGDVNGNAYSLITDGTNSANVVAGDTGFNGIATASGVKTLTFTTSTPGAQTILANTDVRGYSWIEIVYTTVGSGLALAGAYSTVSGGTYVNSQSFIAVSATGNNISSLGTTVNTIYAGPIHGNFFQIAVSALTSGTFAGTVTLRAFPPPLNPAGVNALQSGTWVVGSNSATGSAVPANAFYQGIIDAGGALQGVRAIGAVTDGNGGGTAVSMGSLAYNNSNYDRVRNNLNTTLIAGGTTTTQTGITLTNYNGKGIMFLVNIASGAGTVTVAINGVSTSYSTNLLTSAALVGVGVTALRIFDGATPTTNLVANDKVPRNISVTATVVGTIAYGIDAIITL